MVFPGGSVRPRSAAPGRTLIEISTKIRGAGAMCVLCAAQSRAGLGLTELALRHGYAVRTAYPAGVWFLPAGGFEAILPLLATLAERAEFPFTPSYAASLDPELQGLEVLDELTRRADDAGGSALLILDNVDSPDLLVDALTARSPGDKRLRFLATTRLRPDDFGDAAGQLGIVTIDGITAQDALDVIRWAQPVRADGKSDFASPAQEAAALQIVDLLGGLTVAVQQIADYLGDARDVTPADVLAQLQAHGLQPPADLEALAAAADGSAEAVGEEVGEDVGDRHTLADADTAVLAAVLAVTLGDLDAPTRTALECAALLPADTVPWAWLLAATTWAHPQILAPAEAGMPSPWDRVRATLQARRLVMSGPDPQTGRMHELVGAAIRRDVSLRRSALVTEVLTDRLVGEELWASQSVSTAAAVRHTLDTLITRQPGWTTALFDELPDTLVMLSDILGPGRMLGLARRAVATVRALGGDQAHASVRLRRVMCAALDYLGDQLRDTDRQAALDIYQAALGIRRGVVKARPTDWGALSEVADSLDRISDNNTVHTRVRAVNSEARAIREAVTAACPDSPAAEAKANTTKGRISHLDAFGLGNAGLHFAILFLQWSMCQHDPELMIGQHRESIDIAVAKLRWARHLPVERRVGGGRYALTSCLGHVWDLDGSPATTLLAPHLRRFAAALDEVDPQLAREARDLAVVCAAISYPR